MVCLRGGDRGTYLGDPLLRATLEVLRAKSLLLCGEKLIFRSYNIFRSTSKFNTLPSKAEQL